MKTTEIMNIWNKYYKEEVLSHNLTIKEGIEMLANQVGLSYKQAINVLYCF
ncbi:hypothetical protein ALC152_18660 [Arcobacter sp. 15-2]|uniref:hypothetical protein n=1 Tax=Arcobacter sp. 15-2 TaxID=3374109 RepID=UPI00399D1344